MPSKVWWYIFPQGRLIAILSGRQHVQNIFERLLLLAINCGFPIHLGFHWCFYQGTFFLQKPHGLPIFRLNFRISPCSFIDSCLACYLNSREIKVNRILWIVHSMSERHLTDTISGHSFPIKLLLFVYFAVTSQFFFGMYST